MHNDRRRGAGFWSGCFKFHNIIFDGDKSQWTKPRTGGLKQGGTYWYFYRLDYDAETYDDSKEFTSGCPLLPGQMVNVIEVPMEVVKPCRSRSASFDVIGTLANLPNTHTFDPGDKFSATNPPPISKVHERCISDLALNGRLENTTHPASEPSEPLPASPQVDLPPPPSSRSYHSELEQPLNPNAGRFYAQGGYVDDRSSIYSGRSWRSAAPSFSHSSFVDLYSDEPAESPIQNQPAPLTCSLSEIERPSSGVPVDNPCENDESLDSAYRIKLGRENIDSPPPPESQCLEDDSFAFDICSPTYSAATISSNGGLNTPHRTSDSHPSSAYAEAPDDSIEHVAERLRSLGSLDRETSLPSLMEESDEAAEPFTGYTLPNEAVQSTQSLDQLSSGKTSTITSFPTILMPENENGGVSLADEIFSQLTFL